MVLLFVVTIISCHKNHGRTEAEKIVTEWIGKTIQFPNGITLTLQGIDSLDNSITPYKILFYADSIGCTSCKLQLYKWNTLIKEVESTMSEKVSFLFYFQPKDLKELQLLFKQDRFNHSVFIDQENRINKINKFPNEPEFHCFLLDNNNKVLSIGNPTLNTKIWDLYKNIITQGKNEKISQKPLTTVNIEQSEIEIKNLVVGKKSSATFVIKNIGNVPLLISHIDASCGCTTPSWDKKPIKSKEETHITVEVKPDSPGYFNKTIYAYMNTEDKIICLKIRGMVN